MNAQQHTDWLKALQAPSVLLEGQQVALSAATIRAIAVALADELELRGAVPPAHEFYRSTQ